MPAIALVPAAISAAAAIYGAHKSSQAAKEGTAAQKTAAEEALAFQREQEASRKANYDRAYNIWNASRNALLERYGIDIADTPGAVPGAEGPPGAAGPMPPPPGAGPGGPAGPAMAQGGYAPPSIRELIQAKGEVDPWKVRSPFTA